MRTELAPSLLATPEGRRADEILRACVHCGFCNATCPTYQQLGDELDGPRGRIYLIKGLLEYPDEPESVRIARTHLDRCLTCRACETTCPSGVRYAELLEIGRMRVEDGTHRGLGARLLRRLLTFVLPRRRLFRVLAGLGRSFRWMLPGVLTSHLPAGVNTRWPVPVARQRRVALLQGCVQDALTPQVNAQLASLLDRKGIEAVRVEDESCCGALALHLADQDRAQETMTRNVVALAAMVPDVEAILSTASGCGVTVKEYDRHLAGHERAGEAKVVAEATRDVAEYLREFQFDKRTDVDRVAFQPPCSLQHGQAITGVVEDILRGAGYELVAVADAHLCCGSAGTYSLLHSGMARTLRSEKLRRLTAARPHVIATANVGCQTHLGAGTNVPVMHWIELLR